MTGDPDLFDLEESPAGDAGDVDLFGDFEVAGPSGETGEETGGETTVSPEELTRSIENFYQIFSNRDERMNAASGAILLYQHLLGAGYETRILVEDAGATVSATSREDALTAPLLERVEFLLNDMVYMRRSWKLSGFTVHSVSTNMRDDCLDVRIDFVSV